MSVQAHEKEDSDLTQDSADNRTDRDLEQGDPADDAKGSQQHATSTQPDFSVFTVWQKRWIILAGSFAGWFSPMTGSIYFPALDVIAKDLNTSATQINLTVTTYLILQGLAPMFVAGFSDKAGRRPAYIACFVIYIFANLGLALQNSFPALLVLRMLQSAGSSGTVALANGLVGDLVTSSERGMYVAWASLGSVLGPSLSPVLGGLLSQYLGWHWIFWFLLILSVAFVIPFLLFLPETCRNIVDDGSVPPPWTSWNITDYIRHKHFREAGKSYDEGKLQRTRANFRITLPNPIPTVKVLFDRAAALNLLATALGLACFYAISTGASEVFATVYGFDQLDVGLIFLTLGGGSIISAFTTGKLVDFNYRRHARMLNLPVERNKQSDLKNFPIERARIEIALPLLLLGAASVLGYGWMMTVKVSLAGPIIMLFILGYALVAGFQCLQVLMVDMYPGKPATAIAANNLTRCLLGAAASAAIYPMSKAMGYGWAYTILALLYAISCLGLVVLMKRGITWRRKTALDREEQQAKNSGR